MIERSGGPIRPICTHRVRVAGYAEIKDHKRSEETARLETAMGTIEPPAVCARSPYNSPVDAERFQVHKKNPLQIVDSSRPRDILKD